MRCTAAASSRSPQRERSFIAIGRTHCVSGFCVHEGTAAWWSLLAALDGRELRALASMREIAFAPRHHTTSRGGRLRFLYNDAAAQFSIQGKSHLYAARTESAPAARCNPTNSPWLEWVFLLLSLCYRHSVKTTFNTSAHPSTKSYIEVEQWQRFWYQRPLCFDFESKPFYMGPISMTIKIWSNYILKNILYAGSFQFKD